MLRWEFCGFNDAYTAVKGDKIMQKEIRRWHLKIMHHLFIALQKLMA